MSLEGRRVAGLGSGVLGFFTVPLGTHLSPKPLARLLSLLGRDLAVRSGALPPPVGGTVAPCSQIRYSGFSAAPGRGAGSPSNILRAVGPRLLPTWCPRSARRALQPGSREHAPCLPRLENSRGPRRATRPARWVRPRRSRTRLRFA